MPEFIENALQVILALLGAYLAAFWFCLVVWTFRDIQKRTSDVLVQIMATVLVLLFNLPGLLLYTILRPPETLADAYARQLQEEALMQEVEVRECCPTCKARVEPDYLVCPSCQTQLNRLCPYCNRVLRLHWGVCPY
ncbi:MAG: zinc ribbon domain-containing protein, partial [Chloroflexota bacterium]